MINDTVVKQKLEMTMLTLMEMKVNKVTRYLLRAKAPQKSIN